MLQFQPLPYNDFSGGFTDNYIGAPLNQHRKMENLSITPDKHAISRWGSVIYNSTYYQITDGAVRIGTLLPYEKSDTLLYHYGRKLYHLNPGFTNLTGLGGNQAFDSATTSNFLSWGSWKKHLYVACDSLNWPVAVYKNESGVLKMRTAGLPALNMPASSGLTTALTDLLTLALAIKTDMAGHMTSTAGGRHGTADAASVAVVTHDGTYVGVYDKRGLVLLVNDLLQSYDQHWVDSSKGGPTYHAFPNSVNPGQSTAGARLAVTNLDEEDASYPDIAAALVDLQIKYNKHQGDADVHNGSRDSTYFSDEASVDSLYYGPQIGLDMTPIYKYARAIAAKFDAHIALTTGYHNSGTSTANSDQTCTTKVHLSQIVQSLRTNYDIHTNANAAVAYKQRHNSGIAAGEQLTEYMFGALDTSYSPKPDQGSPGGDVAAQLAYLAEIQTKYNLHQKNTTAHNGSFVANTLPVNGQAPEIGSYVYAFHYAYTYFVGTVEFQLAGPVVFVEVPEMLTIETQSNVIDRIPLLINTSVTNYDTTNMVLRIARTTNGGTEFYYVGEVPAGDNTGGITYRTFTDRVTDARLQNLEPLYTNGGVVDNDTPPKCKAFHITGNRAYYGNCSVSNQENGTTTTELFPNRIYQSLENALESVPLDSNVDIEDEVFWISSAKTRVVVGGKSNIYRLDGEFDEQGRGLIAATKVIEGIGSECPQSAVQAEGGVFFFGSDGVYFTDGFQCVPVSTHWPVTYASLVATATQRRTVQGVFMETERKILWTVDKNGTGECDTLLVLDLRWGMSPTMSFTTWANGADFRPTAISVFNGLLLRGDSRGYVFKHGTSYLSDPKVNTGANPSTWAAKAITFDLVTGSTDFGNANLLKFCNQVLFNAKNNGNLSLQIKTIIDDQSTSYAMQPIRFRQAYAGMIQEERYLPSAALRCTYRAMQFTNGEVPVTNSDTLGTATVNQGLKLAVLGAGSWPTDPIDWKIYFESDGYVLGYTITARTADTLTFADPGATCPTGVQKWVLKGAPKDERFELINCSVQYALQAPNQTPYTTTGAGNNA